MKENKILDAKIKKLKLDIFFSYGWSFLFVFFGIIFFTLSFADYMYNSDVIRHIGSSIILFIFAVYNLIYAKILELQKMFLE